MNTRSQPRSEREAGRKYLLEQLQGSNARIQATIVAALRGGSGVDAPEVERVSLDPGILEMAIRGSHFTPGKQYDDDKYPPGARAEAIVSLNGPRQIPRLLALCRDPDPYIRHAAVRGLALHRMELDEIELASLSDPRERIGLLLAWRMSGRKDFADYLAAFLADRDPDVRFLTVKWVSDEKLTAFRPKIVEMLKDTSLDPRAFVALTTALARLDDKPVNEDSLAAYCVERLADRSAPAPARLMALKAVPATSPKLPPALLLELLKQDDPAFRLEALRVLKDRADAKTAGPVRALAMDSAQPVAVRAQAVVTLAAQGQVDVDSLLGLVGGTDPTLQREALRALVGAKLTPAQTATVEAATRTAGDIADLAARVLGKSPAAGRPPLTDTNAWLKRLEGPADVEAGRRVFEHTAVGGCFRCHRVDGRGANVGPDLSLIGRTERRWIVESILQPSAVVAPHYQAWKVETTDGQVRTGLLVHTQLDESVYVDEKGARFKVLAGDVAAVTPAKNSLMPDGLLDKLTDQEARDLVAFLASRK